jgi:cytochrome c oxidase cbb3-type subunit 3
MTEFTSGFWDVYVAVITVVSIVACAAFLWAQGSRKTSRNDTTGHTWDEDLAEYNNPLPLWWSWLFYITVVFSLGYLVLYPGLGSSWKGTLGWSQAAQFRDETRLAEKQFGPLYEKFAAMDVEAMMKSPEALGVAQKLFLNNCAQCHASDGAGSRGFPNLTDRDWLWGGDAATIQATIANGRTGVMPAFGEALGEQKVKNVAHYVLSLSGATADSLRVAYGKDVFMSTCAACHGPEGRGNPLLGAPNLTDRIWLHGSGEAAIIQTVSNGRTNHMPAHKDSLGEARIRLLAAYVLSLSAARN